MRRLARVLFTLFSAVSLLLCIAACVLWARSRSLNEQYFASYVFNRSLQLETADGVFLLKYRPAFGPPEPPGRPFRYGQWSQPRTGSQLTLSFLLPKWNWGPFGYASRAWPTDPRQREQLRIFQSMLDRRARALADPDSQPGTPGSLLRRRAENELMMQSRAAREHAQVFGAARDLLFHAWSAVILFGVAPTFVAFTIFRRAIQRRRRAAQGLCRSCGYDLRESPDRCPECGTPTPVRLAGSAV